MEDDFAQQMSLRVTTNDWSHFDVEKSVQHHHQNLENHRIERRRRVEIVLQVDHQHFPVRVNEPTHHNHNHSHFHSHFHSQSQFRKRICCSASSWGKTP